MHSNLAGMQVWHSYYTISLHIKLLMKTWLIQLMVVMVLNKKLINAHLDKFFFCGKLFCDCSLEVQILSRFYYGKIVFNGNISMFFYIYLSLYTCIQMGCLVFVVFEKYLATSNKNLFSTSGIHSSPKSEQVWYCLRKLFEKLKQMNSQYLFSRNKGEITPF